MKYFKENKLIVIDAGGAERLKNIATYYKRDSCEMSQARQIGYNLSDTEFIMNLDSDVIIPEGYIEAALKLFANDQKLAIVSIFFDDINHNAGTLEYGISIWRTKIVKELYDYFPKSYSEQIIQIAPRVFTGTIFPYCECSYMFQKALGVGYKIETLPIRAKHLNRVMK